MASKDSVIMITVNPSFQGSMYHGLANGRQKRTNFGPLCFFFHKILLFVVSCRKKSVCGKYPLYFVT